MRVVKRQLEHRNEVDHIFDQPRCPEGLHRCTAPSICPGLPRQLISELHAAKISDMFSVIADSERDLE